MKIFLIATDAFTKEHKSRKAEKHHNRGQSLPGKESGIALHDTRIPSRSIKEKTDQTCHLGFEQHWTEDPVQSHASLRPVGLEH